MKKILFFLLFIKILLANNVDCIQIFEERKQELLHETQKLDEARQSLEALQAATKAFFEKRESQVKQMEEDINKTLEDISLREKQINDMINENKNLLKAIKDSKESKITQTYSKMKDNAAAEIFSKMQRQEAADILSALPAKKVSSIMGKMNPEIASEVTLLILKEENTTSQKK